MPDAEKLVEAARNLADSVLRLASELLAADIDVERVHGRYVSAAFELLEEVEARAVLASAGDEDALGRLELLVHELKRLREEAREEFRGQADGDREA